jgi:hypothetical protein
MGNSGCWPETAMTATDSPKPKLKTRIAHELTDYAITVIYLAAMFGGFGVYRRLLLAEYDITYLEYGANIIEALILGKIILIGEHFHVGERLHDKPLILSTLYKTALFSLWVLVFISAEHFVRGLFRGEDANGSFRGILERNWREILARIVMMFVAFIPFFAFREIGRVMGEGKLRALFFRPRGGPGATVSQSVTTQATTRPARAH